MEYNDSELVQMFRKGENKNYAFNLILLKHQTKVYNHMRHMVLDHDDANDLVQDTFIKVWNGLDNFREDSQLFTWIYRIATNEALAFLKKKKNRFFLPIHDLTHELEQKLVSDKSINVNKLELKLQQAIVRLPTQQRVVFNMRYYDEMKYEEIAQVLGLTTGSLKATYHHAVKKIEKFITGN